jgi:SAM-dependent methyltransferase
MRLRRVIRPALVGAFWRTRPLSDSWGYDRGKPIDRHYIESFLSEHRGDIRGDTLEVKENLYVERYGHEVARVDVLDVDAANPNATIVGDLSEAASLPADRFDCIVLTQTLQYVTEVRTAIENVHRALRRRGVVLATVPGLNRADATPTAPSLWSFTEAGCRTLFAAEFEDDRVGVRSYGNVLAAVGFLTGMAREEFRPRELSVHDPRFPVIVAVRAVRT